MRIIAAFIILMVCGLSAAGQRDSVIVNDGWRKDTVRVKGQVFDTLGKGTLSGTTRCGKARKKGETTWSNLP